MDTQSDFILQGGRVIDPGQNLNGLMDVAVKDGKIAAIGESVGDGINNQCCRSDRYPE